MIHNDIVESRNIIKTAVEVLELMVVAVYNEYAKLYMRLWHYDLQETIMYEEITNSLLVAARNDFIFYALAEMLVGIGLFFLYRFFRRHDGQVYFRNKFYGAFVFFIILNIHMLFCLGSSSIKLVETMMDKRSGEVAHIVGILEEKNGVCTSKQARKLTVDDTKLLDDGTNVWIQWMVGQEYDITYLKHSGTVLNATVTLNEIIPEGSAVDHYILNKLGVVTEDHVTHIMKVNDIAVRYLRAYLSYVHPEEWENLSKEGLYAYGYLNLERGLFFVEAYSCDENITQHAHIVLDQEKFEPLYLWIEAN